MPPRTGPNGAVIKPSASTKSRRTARATTSKVIDLTRESTDETSRNSSAEGLAEEESKDVPTRHGEEQDRRRGHQFSSASGAGQATGGRQKTHNHQRVARRGQEHTLEESFVVTSLHHRPWGAGDDNATIGVFSTEKEAKSAASKDFLQRCESTADGWESKWHRCPGDGMLQLRGCIEDGEDDLESYRASIKRV